MKTTKTLTLIAILITLGCSTLPRQAHADTYYRFFRGVQRTDLSHATFLDKMGTTFIPAAPQTHAKNGLVGYIPALMPDQVRPIADEIALIAYESEEAYDKAKATPEGQAYSALHATVFNMDLSKRAGSKLYRPGDDIAVDQAYDAIGGAPNWKTGYTTLWVGTRKKGSGAEFLGFLKRHVVDISGAFGKHSLRGYVFLATADDEIAFQTWDSKAAFDEAFADPSVKPLTDEASQWMDAAYFDAAVPFQGRAEDGKTYDVTW